MTTEGLHAATVLGERYDEVVAGLTADECWKIMRWIRA